MFRVSFQGETALEAVKGMYEWLAENPGATIADVVVNRQPGRWQVWQRGSWEAVVYVDVRDQDTIVPSMPPAGK